MTPSLDWASAVGGGKIAAMPVLAINLNGGAESRALLSSLIVTVKEEFLAQIL
jgi:hypothetical protein